MKESSNAKTELAFTAFRELVAIARKYGLSRALEMAPLFDGFAFGLLASQSRETIIEEFNGIQRELATLLQQRYPAHHKDALSWHYTLDNICAAKGGDPLELLLTCLNEIRGDREMPL